MLLVAVCAITMLLGAVRVIARGCVEWLLGDVCAIVVLLGAVGCVCDYCVGEGCAGDCWVALGAMRMLLGATGGYACDYSAVGGCAGECWGWVCGYCAGGGVSIVG
jgi:hypothetical protein